MILVRDSAADLVLSGHDEHLLTFYDGKTALTESYSQADYVVVTEVTIDKTEKDGKVSVSWTPNFDIVDTTSVEPDPEIAALVKSYTDKLDAELKVEIGTTATPLDSRRATVRGQEAAIGNLIADAMREAVGADIAITNGGGIRADKEYPAGTKLTRGDILAELPFGNVTVKLELTGEQIRQALENGFSQVREVAGRFPQVSGLTVEVDLTQPPGERVISVTVGGAPLDPAKIYTRRHQRLHGRAAATATQVLAGAKNLIDPVGRSLHGEPGDRLHRRGGHGGARRSRAASRRAKRRSARMEGRRPRRPSRLSVKKVRGDAHPPLAPLRYRRRTYRSSLMSPFSKPRRNQVARCSDVPCVKLSGTT